jgi:hypothetical protein
MDSYWGTATIAPVFPTISGCSIQRPVSARVVNPVGELYYRFHQATEAGPKHLCVVGKISQDDAFVVTACLTDSVKRGWRLWPETE